MAGDGPVADPTRNPVVRALEVFGLYPSGGHLVKRVIAVGGERVVCCDKQGRLTVDGAPLDEQEYLRKGTPPSQKQFDVVVPEDAVWVMGDNRSNSQDSRFHLDDPGGGAVPLENVVGKVWAIVWPTDRLEILEQPEGFASVAP